MSAHLRLLAEHSNTYEPLGPGEERIENDRYVIWLGPGTHPGFTVVQRLQLGPEYVEPTVREVRSLLRERSRPVSTWEVAGSATPADLGERLRALGMVPDDEHYVVGMVLTERPAEPPPGVVARAVETFEEYVAAKEIAWEGFALAAEHREEERKRFERAWAERARSPSTTFLAFLDGEPVASATGLFTEHGVVLNGGSTLTHARGRGAYRALVAARWEDAARRGTPALVVQAGAMSRPILRRLGFREVAEIWIYRDDFGLAV